MANFMPKRLSDFMVAALTFFVSHILKFRKNIIVSNLKNAFASSKSSIEISKLVEANYRHYAEVFFDVICGLNWTRDETIMKTDCQGEENLRGSETQKSGGFILASHLGNWELSIQIAASRGHKLCVVVKKPQTSWGEILLQKFRTRYGIKVIYETGITKDIFGALADGYWVVFVLDQFMGPPIGVPVKFFGLEAGTAAGLALFALRSGLPVVPTYNFRNTKGRLVTVFEKPMELKKNGDDTKRSNRILSTTQQFNDQIQKHIELYPAQWLWLHRRWKPFVGESRWSPT